MPFAFSCDGKLPEVWRRGFHQRLLSGRVRAGHLPELRSPHNSQGRSSSIPVGWRGARGGPGQVTDLFNVLDPTHMAGLKTADGVFYDDSYDHTLYPPSAVNGGMACAGAAEGVETREQLERVRAEGCTEAQGYAALRDNSRDYAGLAGECWNPVPLPPPRPLQQAAHRAIISSAPPRSAARWRRALFARHSSRGGNPCRNRTSSDLWPGGNAGSSRRRSACLFRSRAG
jgi:hypothetical protein